MERADLYFADLDYFAAENAAARLVRKITSRPTSWDELIAIAQRIIGHYQNEVRNPRFRLDSLYDEQEAKPLIAAARIFQAAAETASRDEEHDQDDTKTLIFMAAAAYSMYGNFPGSHACLALLPDTIGAVESAEQAVALGSFSPLNIGEALSHLAEYGYTAAFECAESLNAYLTTADERYGEIALSYLDEILGLSATPFDVALLRSARLAMRHQITLATSMTLRDHSGLSPEIAVRLGRNAPSTLLPPQYRAIINGFLRSRGNTLVTLPTSTGKTLLAEFALVSGVLNHGRIGVFVAPYVTIANQTRRSLQKLVRGLGIRVHSSFANSPALPIDTGQPQIVITTPETLDSLLHGALNIDDVGTIVFDEAHLVENGVRGAHLEGVLTRFRLRQRAGLESRIILMSAVLANADELKSWLNIEERDHILDSWRPTARRVAVWTQDSTLMWLYGPDPLKPDSARTTTSLGQRRVGLVEHMYPAETFAQMRSQWNASYRNVAYLVDQLTAEIGGPILAVCMTKRATRGVARAIARLLPEIEFGVELNRLESLVETSFPNLRVLLQCVRHGVAYHNASLPPVVRAAIEAAVTSRELLAVASTTTLAEGADLPFRVTVLYDWLQGFGAGQRPISPLLFRNIAGRAGRAGIFVEGDTVIFENVLGALKFTREQNRRDVIRHIVDALPTLHTAFELASSPEEEAGIEAAFSSNFVAAVAENSDVEDIADQYVGISFTGTSVKADKMVSSISASQTAILDDSLGEPLGIAASPIRLTDLGRAVFRSGLSPHTARLLISIMPELRGLELDNLVKELIIRACSVPEQTYSKLREVGLGRAKQHPVKIDDIEALSLGWRNRDSLLSMFLELPFVQRSKRTPPIAVWLAGTDPAESWDEVFDSFVDFVESTFGSFVPSIARACSFLQPFSTTPAAHDWAAIAAAYEERLSVEGLDDLINLGH